MNLSQGPKVLPINLKSSPDPVKNARTNKKRKGKIKRKLELGKWLGWWTLWPFFSLFGLSIRKFILHIFKCHLGAFNLCVPFYVLVSRYHRKPSTWKRQEKLSWVFQFQSLASIKVEREKTHPSTRPSSIAKAVLLFQKRCRLKLETTLFFLFGPWSYGTKCA